MRAAEQRFLLVGPLDSLATERRRFWSFCKVYILYCQSAFSNILMPSLKATNLYLRNVYFCCLRVVGCFYLNDRVYGINLLSICSRVRWIVPDILEVKLKIEVSSQHVEPLTLVLTYNDCKEEKQRSHHDRLHQVSPAASLKSCCCLNANL